MIAERDILLAARRDSPYFAPDSTEIELSGLEHAPFILLKKGRGIRRMADRLFQAAGIAPTIAYETDSYNMALGMAREGFGCTFVIDHELRLPEDMEAYRIAGATETYRMYLVYRRDTYLSRPLQYFIELAKQMDRG